MFGHLPALYRDTRNVHKLCYMTAKTRAIPSLHRDYFSAKEPESARCLCRVTQPPFIAGPLAINLAFQYIYIQNEDKVNKEAFEYLQDQRD